MILFYLFIAIKAEIPSHLKNLANQAIANSLNKKIPRGERENTAYPGNFSFPNVQFTLKRILSAPTTNDIKGYAIDLFNVAIVKRKAFNLKEHFVFVDPKEQRFYDMNELIASDDKVNIYSTKDLTIFDIMTNFDYHGKTEKAFSPTINLNWDTANNGPNLKEIPFLNGFKYGLGAYGQFTIDTFFRFSSFTDISLGANLIVQIKAAAEVSFYNGEAESKEDILLFELPSIPIKGLGINFNFIGIEFSIQPYIKCKAFISDIHIVVPNNVDYLKGYNVIATKFIEITPFSITDTKWNLYVGNLPEKNSLEEIVDTVKKAEFHMIPKFRFYLSIEMKFAGIESYFDVGLQIPFEFTFGFDSNKCLMPYLYGKMDINLQMFYEFGGITVTYHDITSGFKKKSKQLLKSSSKEKSFYKILSGKFCLGVPNKAVEGSSDVLQQNYKRAYYIHNDNFVWKNKGKNPAQIVVEAKSNVDQINLLRMLPYTNWPLNTNTGVKPKTHLIITSSQPPVVSWHVNFYETYTKTEKKCFIICNTYTYEQTELKQTEPYNLEIEYDQSLVSKNYQFEMNYENQYKMSGQATVYFCRDIEFNKVFKREKGSIVITKIPCDNSNYVLLNLDKNGNTNIDYTAEFYAETMLDEEYAEKGVFHGTKDHFNIKYLKFEIDEPMLVETNFTLTTLQKGKIVTQTFGSISTFFSEAKEYSAADVGIDKQNFNFYLKEEFEPKLETYFKWTSFKSNGQTVIRKFSSSFNYTLIKQYQYASHVQLIFPDSKSSFYIKIENIVSPQVTIKTDLTLDHEEVIAEIFDINLDKYYGNFEPITQGDATYFVLNVTSTSKCIIPLKGNYLVIKNNKMTPLVKGMIKVSSDVFCIPCDSNSILIPIRKMRDENVGKYDRFLFEFIITDFNNPNEMAMNEQNETITFTSPENPKAFIIPKERNLNDYYRRTLTIFHTYTLDIDDERKILAIKNPNKKPETVTFTKAYLIMEEDQFMASFDVSYISQINADEYSTFYVNVHRKSKYVNYIRCRNKLVSVDPYFDYAPFNIPYPKTGTTVDFYAYCTENNTKNCEIVSTSTEGEYQLVRFPSKEGINITGRGMNTAIIHVPSGSNFSYYKTYDDPIEIIRHYGLDTNVTIEVTDFVIDDDDINNTDANSSDIIPELNNIDDDDNNTNSNPFENSYRKFCAKDDNDNIIPFSLKYFSENIEDLMKALGAIDDIDVTQYDISDDDCIIIDFSGLKTNDINEISPNAVDLKVSTDTILFDTEKIKFVPPKIIEPKKKNKLSKGAIIGIVVGCIFGVIVIIAVIIGVWIFIKKKQAKNDESTNENINETANNTNTENNNQVDEI